MTEAAIKAYVPPVAGREMEIAAIKKLIADSGGIIVCDEDSIEAFEHCVQEADVIVILICTETLENETIEELIGLANRLGKRIVGIYAHGAEAGKLPGALNRYGDAAVDQSPEAICKAVFDRGTEWTTPDGEPRPRPKTPRHKG